MNKLENVLNIPHFKEETLKRIDLIRKNKISFTTAFPTYSNKKIGTYNSHNIGQPSPETKAENFLSLNLAKAISITFNHEDVLVWQNNSLFFDYFKLFESNPMFINDERVNINIKYKDISIEYLGSARFNDICGEFLIGSKKDLISKIAKDFCTDSSSKFFIDISLENPESLIQPLKLDDGHLWEEIFLKDLKIDNFPETLKNLSPECLDYLDEYNRKKELDLFYNIKLSLNAKSL